MYIVTYLSIVGLALPYRTWTVVMFNNIHILSQSWFYICMLGYLHVRHCRVEKNKWMV